MGTERPGGDGTWSLENEKEARRMDKARCPEKAVIESGRIRCPYCGGFIGNAYYGAYAGCIELRCSNGRCKKFYRLDL